MLGKNHDGAKKTLEEIFKDWILPVSLVSWPHWQGTSVQQTGSLWWYVQLYTTFSSIKLFMNLNSWKCKMILILCLIIKTNISFLFLIVKLFNSFTLVLNNILLPHNNFLLFFYHHLQLHHFVTLITETSSKWSTRWIYNGVTAN